MSHWQHMLHHCHREGGKAGAVGMIVIGFFLAPMLIGLPIMGYGIYKLLK